jgi:hypothetical protein
MVTRTAMTNIDSTAATAASQPKKTKTKKVQKRETWRRYAERHGVSTRTLDRWVENGIIPAPEYIRERKYINPDIEPRQDAAKPSRSAPRKIAASTDVSTTT